MGWKNWPRWLKGGMVGVSLGVILDIIVLFLADINILYELAIFILRVIGFPWIFIIGYTLKFFVRGFSAIPQAAFAFGGLIGIITNGFIIGAIIGFIIGKIKSRRKKK